VQVDHTRTGRRRLALEELLLAWKEDDGLRERVGDKMGGPRWLLIRRRRRLPQAGDEVKMPRAASCS
jgi:hypothetical protein